MTFTRMGNRDEWRVPVNEKGEEDWLCPKCGHEHTSCCGNSHFPCKKSPNYGGDCRCDYLDSLAGVWVDLNAPPLKPAVEKVLEKKLGVGKVYQSLEGVKCLYPDCSKPAYSKFRDVPLCREHWDLSQWISYIISEERWIREGRYPRPAKSSSMAVKCPYCDQEQLVVRRFFEGVSMGETGRCGHCGHEISIVYYYDGDVTVSKPLYRCDICGTTADNRDEMEKTHYATPNGGWKCKEVAGAKEE